MPERARSLTEVALSDGRVVGVLDAWLDFFGSGDLARLVVRVDPAFRGRGIGGELYERGLEHIGAFGAARAASAFEESPEGVAFADIDPDTGKLATPRCPRTINEAFLSSSQPTEFCDLHR